MQIENRKIKDRFYLTFSEQAILIFESENIKLSDQLRLVVSDVLSVDVSAVASANATATAGAVSFSLNCNTEEFDDRVQSAALDGKTFRQAYWHVWRGAELIASGDCLLYKSTSSQGQSPAPTPIDTFATTEYVDEQIEALKTDLEPQLEAIKEDTEQIILDVSAVETKVDALSIKTSADKNEVLAAITALGGAIDNYRNTGA